MTVTEVTDWRAAWTPGQLRQEEIGMIYSEVGCREASRAEPGKENPPRGIKAGDDSRK